MLLFVTCGKQKVRKGGPNKTYKAFQRELKFEGISKETLKELIFGGGLF